MRKLKFLLSFLIVLLSTMGLLVNAEESQLIKSGKVYYDYFNTTLAFEIYADQEVPEEHWDEIEDILYHVEMTFSRTEENSELHQLNASAGSDEPFPVSKDLYYVIDTALEYAKKTKGKYNPAIGPLLDLWGPTGAIEKVPTKEDIDNIKGLLDYTKIKLETDGENYYIHLPEKGMSIDLGSIAKGYAADLVHEKIVEFGYEKAIIDLGMSSLSVIGERPEKNRNGNYRWLIGLKNPNPLFCTKTGCQDAAFGSVELVDMTITTTGTDQRYWFVEDDPEKKQYHHILDPDTGFPVGNIVQQVTVISKNATIGDALSTSLKVIGIKEGLRLVEELDDVEAIFLTYNREIYVSSGIGSKIPFEIYHDSFQLKDLSELPKEDDIIYYERPNNVTKPLLIALGIIVGTSTVIIGIYFGVKKIRKL